MENGPVVQRSSARDRGVMNDAFEMNDHQTGRGNTVCSRVYL